MAFTDYTVRPFAGPVTSPVWPESVRGNDETLRKAHNSLATYAVQGPASSTDNAIARFDGTTGVLIQNSGVTIDDSDNLTLPTGANRYIQVGSVSNYYYRLRAVGDDFQFIEAGSTVRGVIKYPNGYWGFGTDNPQYPVQVRRAGGAGSLGITVDNVGSIQRVAQFYSVGDATTATTGHAFYTRNATASDVLAVVIDNNQRLGVGVAAPSYKLDVAGPGRMTGHTFATVAKTTTYTVTTEDSFVTCNATGGAFTVTLPPAASATGFVFDIKKVDSSANAVTVDADGTETIDGATTVALLYQYENVTVQSNGTSWFIL